MRSFFLFNSLKNFKMFIYLHRRFNYTEVLFPAVNCQYQIVLTSDSQLGFRNSLSRNTAKNTNKMIHTFLKILFRLGDPRIYYKNSLHQQNYVYNLIWIFLWLINICGSLNFYTKIKKITNRKIYNTDVFKKYIMIYFQLVF